MICAPSEDSDQPGHLPSLIRVLAVRMKKPWVLGYPLSALQRLWSDWADAQADLSLRWVYRSFCWFFSCAGWSSTICYGHFEILISFVTCKLNVLKVQERNCYVQILQLRALIRFYLYTMNSGSSSLIWISKGTLGFDRKLWIQYHTGIQLKLRIICNIFFLNFHLKNFIIFSFFLLFSTPWQNLNLTKTGTTII